MTSRRSLRSAAPVYDSELEDIQANISRQMNRLNRIRAETEAQLATLQRGELGLSTQQCAEIKAGLDECRKGMQSALQEKDNQIRQLQAQIAQLQKPSSITGVKEVQVVQSPNRPVSQKLLDDIATNLSRLGYPTRFTVITGPMAQADKNKPTVLVHKTAEGKWTTEMPRDFFLKFFNAFQRNRVMMLVFSGTDSTGVNWQDDSGAVPRVNLLEFDDALVQNRENEEMLKKMAQQLSL